MVADLPQGGADEASMNDFRLLVYALDAILRLHFAQEDEKYHCLADREYGRTSGTPDCS